MPAARRVGWVALAAALVVAAGTLLPVGSTLPLADGSGAALHAGAARAAALGSPTTSPAGPLGAAFQEDPFAWLLLIRLLLAAVTCWAVAWLGYAVWGSPWAAAIAIVVSVPWLASPDVWFLTLPLLALLLELPERHPSHALAVALGAGIGIVSLIKFSCLVAAAGVLGPLALADAVERRVPSATLAAVYAGGIGWLASGQPLGQVIAWLSLSLQEVAGGSPSAMQFSADRALVVHTGIVALAVLASAWPLLRPLTRLLRWAGRIATGETLFLLVRAGLVRADAHIYITIFGLMVVAVWMALTLGRQRGALAALLVAVVGVGSLGIHTALRIGPPQAYFAPISPLAALQRLATLPSLLSSDPGDGR